MSDRGPAVSTAPMCEPGPDGRCGLCADEALRALVLAVDASTRTAEVELPGGVRVVALDLVDDVAPGDAVLVHQGFAISRVGAA